MFVSLSKMLTTHLTFWNWSMIIEFPINNCWRHCFFFHWSAQSHRIDVNVSVSSNEFNMFDWRIGFVLLYWTLLISDYLEQLQTINFWKTLRVVNQALPKTFNKHILGARTSSKQTEKKTRNISFTCIDIYIFRNNSLKSE